MRIDGTLYFVLKDHLGSASVVTDATGNVVGENRYYPFGETRLTTGTMYTDKLYTGQREMADLGIYHYNARFYSQRLGRFLSADTIVPNPLDPQDLNRFSYVRNNPLRYVDPSGHICTDPEDPTPSCDGSGDYPSNITPLPPAPVVITNPDPLDDGLEQDDPTPSTQTNPGSTDSDILDNDSDVTTILPIPTLSSTQPSSTTNFWNFVSAVGDIALGGFFASLSVYALIGSCVYAGPACVITAPIFFTTAVIGAQSFANGVQSLRQMNDSSIEPTGREVIDFVFPFLKKRGK